MLLFQLAAAVDTVLVRQVPPSRGGFEQVVFIASGLTTIVLFILVVVGLFSLLVLRRKTDELRAKIDELLDDLRPMAKGATAMYADIQETAKSVRETVDSVQAAVDEVKETVDVTNSRVRKSVTLLADRVDGVTAMIGRVQESAEEVVSVAGTALGGLRLGARLFGASRRRKKRRMAERAARHPEIAAEDDEDELPSENRPRLRRRP